MEAARRRFESVVEWALAVTFIAALLGIGSVVVREIRTVNAVTPVIAREPTQLPPVPAGVPPRAVSVPMLLLENGNQVRIGDRAAAITSRLGRQAELRAPMIDHTPTGERLTRFYDYAGTRFSLVFEPVGTSGEMRLAAIYLQ
ncbi:MAG TPA: hypothetical protein VHJ58_02525, partial [Vicinamibacterales bacterium]|jgi:hypothetical protein|nr:hypothetical protein [Vicinamibacterales bacterium]